MKSENKKYLVYGGLALIAGGIGYVAYALIFPKKYKDDATVKLKTENETPTQSNPFKDMLDNPVIPSGIDWNWSGSKLPKIDNIFSQSFMQGGIK